MWAFARRDFAHRRAVRACRCRVRCAGRCPTRQSQASADDSCLCPRSRAGKGGAIRRVAHTSGPGIWWLPSRHTRLSRADTVTQLRAAFGRAGFELDPEGNLRPTVLENLEGVELTEALSAYVRRAQRGASDAELLIGTAKNLEEATVRHVLKERTGDYATAGKGSHFPTALYNAFYALGLTGSEAKLDDDPYRALQKALFLLACAVNRLRNDRGDGHGRPEPSVATALEGSLSTKSAGLVCEFLLAALKSRAK